jgi:predicted alpha/beta superfamily hydrolase
MLRRSSALAAVLLSILGSAGCTPKSPPPSSATLATAPPYTLEDTEVRTLPRSADGRDYLLYVGLPASYAKELNRRYPVLYVCDGYWDFALVRGFYGNLIYDKVVPEYILVGFGYQGVAPVYGALRAWDYTPVPENNIASAKLGSGHASEFLTALEKEILPFVDRTYRTDPGYRVLGGSSLGGLFTLYALFSRPDLFQAYIAPSPAVVWANGWLFSKEAEFAAKQKSLPVRLFMSGASAESPEFLAGIQRFDAQLKGHNYAGLSYDFHIVEGERHAGTKAESYNRGIRFAFAPLVGK